MTKFIMNMLGYALSFLIGCAFTISYVDFKLQGPVKTQINSTIKFEKSEIFKETSELNMEFKKVFELNNFLPEVTIIGHKITATNSGVLNKLTDKKSSIVSDNIYLHSTTVGLSTEAKSSRSSIKLKTLISPLSLEPFVEAKARSPGSLTLENGTLINNINIHKMLRRDKRNLKAILKLLFVGNSSFKVKNNGTIIIKKHWYSQKKTVTSVTEIINYTLPKVMVSLSRDLAEDYTATVLEIKKTNTSELISTAFEQFSNFCIEVGYQGKLVKFDLQSSYLKRKYIRNVLIMQERVEGIKQLNLSSLLVKYLPWMAEEEAVVIIKALPSKKIKSLKEILQIEEFKTTLKKIGLCTTGNPQIDSGMVGVYRLTERCSLI